jgi:hypothetical protein
MRPVLALSLPDEQPATKQATSNQEKNFIAPAYTERGVGEGLSGTDFAIAAAPPSSETEVKQISSRGIQPQSTFQ